MSGTLVKDPSINYNQILDCCWWIIVPGWWGFPGHLHKENAPHDRQESRIPFADWKRNVGQNWKEQIILHGNRRYQWRRVPDPTRPQRERRTLRATSTALLGNTPGTYLRAKPFAELRCSVLFQPKSYFRFYVKNKKPIRDHRSAECMRFCVL